MHSGLGLVLRLLVRTLIFHTHWPVLTHRISLRERGPRGRPAFHKNKLHATQRFICNSNYKREDGVFFPSWGWGRGYFLEWGSKDGDVIKFRSIPIHARELSLFPSLSSSPLGSRILAGDLISVRFAWVILAFEIYFIGIMCLILGFIPVFPLLYFVLACFRFMCRFELKKPKYTNGRMMFKVLQNKRSLQEGPKKTQHSWTVSSATGQEETSKRSGAEKRSLGHQ